jgi:ABC-type uncharacterized transport system auxiliary subunit
MSAGAALAGCSVLPSRPYQVQREWPLVVTRPSVLPPDPHGPVLLVRSFRAGPGLDSRGLQSLAPDGSITTAYYEQWAAPPAEAVEASLRAWLAQCGRFSAVVAPGSLAVADYSLEGELTQLLAEPAHARSVAAISLVMFSNRGGRATPLLQQSFDDDANVTGPDAGQQVASLTRALTGVFSHIELAIEVSLA